AASLAQTSGRNESPPSVKPITHLVLLPGLAPARSRKGQSQENSGASNTMNRAPRYVSEPAVCGKTTLSRKISAKPAAVNAARAHAAAAADRWRRAKATTKGETA